MKIISTGLFTLLMTTVGFGQLINEGALIKAHENDSIYLVFHRELHYRTNLKVTNTSF
jgi:hypothetical protein